MTTTTTDTTTDNTQTPPIDSTATTVTPSTTAGATSPPSTATGDGQAPGEGETATTETTESATTTTTEETGSTDGPPETYEAFTLPDGVALEGDRLTKAHDFFRAQGWSQQRAQDVVSAYLQFRGDEHAAERGVWAELSEQEFGKDFAPIAEGAQRAIKVVEQARPGITARLDATNLGNHPDVLWILSKFGELTQERPLIGLGGDATTPTAPKSVADTLFGG